MLSKILRFVSGNISWTLMFLCVTAAVAQQPQGREFSPGRLSRLDELPGGRLRQQLEALPGPAQERARQWLNSFHFTELDLPALHPDADGGIFYVCDPAKPAAESPAVEDDLPPIGQAAVPVNPFPASLVFHSRPGAPNVLYLDFTGETVTNTQWNTELGRTVIPAVAFSTDGDLSTFSDAEQLAIRRVWQRVAEDYAPFNIDVTTERPATFTIRTAHALITRNTDTNGNPNPADNAGGVAYVNVFNTSTYARYRPGWIYHNNLANDESYIAEATSHEIGHNLGLSHDGKTDGSAYYGGHGSGDTSWGPLMGTGYNRNVSQWCKGEYYLANNTQDDLATIAGKITYRTDDHGNTPGTATALTLTNGTNIVATTLENDPTNNNPANKGVFERNTDLDVFSFITGSGAISLSVKPWIMPSGITRGGNLDVRLELYNEAGMLLLTNNPASQTTALIQTNLVEGRYYLHVRNSGTGSPLNSTPGGYTAYGSIGQFFISGYVTATSGFVVPPVAELQVTDLNQSGQTTKEFTVTYSDNVAVNVSTIDTNDVRILGPNGYNRAAQLVSLSSSNNGTPRVATYAAAPPTGGVWLPAHNGTYTIWMQTNQVSDAEGAWVAPGQLGQFNVAVPATIYAASMSVNPGWTLEPQWEYGPPAYTGGNSPTNGFTGANIIGYNLSGNYENRLDPKYATTPLIDCSGSSSVTLRFRRWLRLRNNDTASIQISTNGTSWINVWSTSSAVSDTSWQSVQYTLPASVAGSSSVRVRWGLASNPAQNDIGWNLDDVELLGDGTLDTDPPVPVLSVADVTLGGSPSHSCSVTYTDATAVRLNTLDSFDVLVTGPNGYSNLVEFTGADLPLNGTPITATYSIPAPDGSWDATNNGVYQVVLMENEVEDTFNNAIPQTALGSFIVAISTASPGVLGVSPVGGLSSSGTVGGPFSPSSIVYTLTNTGGSTLNWTASKAQSWVNLSAIGGSLTAGATTNVTVSLNTNANNLAAGDHTDTVSFINTTSGNGNANRSLTLAINSITNFNLTVAANNPAWGSVSPTNGSYAAGSSLELLATPATYFRFNEWSGNVSGSNNPLTIVVNSNLTVMADFSEVLTTNHPTPLWWLASHGNTNGFEAVVTNVGANGFALWQSYIAGLNPNDPNSQLSLSLEVSISLAEQVLRWSTVSGRVYSVWCSTNLPEGFASLEGATNLPWTIQSVTNPTDTASPGRFYRLEVWKP